MGSIHISVSAGISFRFPDGWIGSYSLHAVSQCEAIHARSIFPCQDTPDVKSIFDYRIRSPLPVITSGNATGTEQYQPGSNGQRGTLLYTFLQEVPIPSYLYGIASGDIATAPIGPRSFVATGPEELVGAKWELEEDTEKFIEVAEVRLSF